MAYHQAFLREITHLEFLDAEIKEKLRIIVNQSLKKEVDAYTKKVASYQASLDKAGHVRTAAELEDLIMAKLQCEEKKEELIKLLPEHYAEEPLIEVLELNDDDISTIIEGFRSSDKKMRLLSKCLLDAPITLYISILINVDDDERNQLLETRSASYLKNLIKETVTLYNDSSAPSSQIEYQTLVQRLLLELIYKTVQDKPASEQNEENYSRVITKLVSDLTKQKSEIWNTLDVTVTYFLPQIQARLDSRVLRPKLGESLRESKEILAKLTPEFDAIAKTRQQLKKDLVEAQKQLERVSGHKLTFEEDQFPADPDYIIKIQELEEKIKKAPEDSIEKSLLSLQLKIKKYIEENRVLNEMLARVSSEIEKAERKKLLESKSSTPSLSEAPTFFRSPRSSDSRSASLSSLSSTREDESIIIEGGLPFSSSTSSSDSEHSVEPSTDIEYNIYAYNKHETAATLNYKFPAWQSPPALALTPAQQKELSFPIGLQVKSPSSQKFNISFNNNIPKTMLTEGYQKEKGETDKGYQERLAVTIICMINNVLTKSTVLNFKSYDAFSLEIAENYVNFLRNTKGLHIEFKNNCSESIKPAAGGREIFDTIKPELAQCAKEPWFLEARIFRHTQKQQLAKVELRTQRVNAELSDNSEQEHRKTGPIIKV